jgi:hypothetical protein
VEVLPTFVSIVPLVSEVNVFSTPSTLTVKFSFL